MSTRLQSLRSRLNEERGATAPEVVVIVIVLAALFIIGLTQMVGLRDNGNDTAAKASIRSAVLAAEIHRAEKNDYTGLDATTPSNVLNDLEPALTSVTAIPAASAGNSNQVAVFLNSTETIATMCVRSKSTRIYCGRVQPGSPTVLTRSAKDIASPATADSTTGVVTGVTSDW